MSQGLTFAASFDSKAPSKPIRIQASLAIMAVSVSAQRAAHGKIAQFPVGASMGPLPDWCRLTLTDPEVLWIGMGVYGKLGTGVAGSTAWERYKPELSREASTFVGKLTAGCSGGGSGSPTEKLKMVKSKVQVGAIWQKPSVFTDADKKLVDKYDANFRQALALEKVFDDLQAPGSQGRRSRHRTAWPRR